MVSITNVSSGQASTYYQRDNYYTRADGQWQGAGASALGLSGAIQKDDFENLIHGRDPQGDRLIAGGGENHEHRAGVDLTFSAPKSVSVLHEVSGDQRILDAHNRAVERTLQYVEEHYTQARQTQDGVTERVDTGNMVIAKFTHYVSRELDMQIHTHGVAMNMTQREDGQWRALSNEELYNNKMHIGQIYRNELAVELKEINYAIKTDSRGFFEIQGIDQKVLDEFSRRSEQIQSAMEDLKKQYPDASESKIKEMACLDSRVAKKDVNMDDVRQTWQERLEKLGYTKEQIQASVQKAAEEMRAIERGQGHENNPEKTAGAGVAAAGRIITEQESVFSRKDLQDTAMKMSIGDARIDDIERAIERAERNGDLIRLDEGKYTTHEMIRIENDIVEKVRDGHGKAEALDAEKVQAGIQEYEKEKGFYLSENQKNAISHILTSKDSVIGIQGDAGTGKTTALQVMREIASRHGYEVKGYAYTGKAAEEIEKASGIQSRTLHSFLGEKTEATAGTKEIWVVDEASMMGSRQMHGLLERAEAAGAKVAMVGDTKQLQSIEAGRMFQKLQETGDMKTVRMSEVQRQKTEDYRDIVKDISEKRFEKAMEKLENTGKIHEIADRQQRIDAIVKDYTDSKKDTIIVTALNKDRNEINDRIHSELMRQGRIGQQEYEFNVRESKNLSPIEKHFGQNYEKGDIVIANHAGIMGRAGTEGKVTRVDHQNHRIEVETRGKNRESVKHEIDLKEHGQNLAVYREKQQSFSQGEKVVFQKNDRSLGVKNGQTGTIESIDKDGRATVKMHDGQEKKINLSTQYNYIDRGYAVTSYKSQGQTADRVIFHSVATEKSEGRGTNYNEAYVAATRGKHDLKIYTNDKQKFTEQMKVEQQKTSTLDYEKTAEWRSEKAEKQTGRKTEKHESARSEKHESRKAEKREYEDRKAQKQHGTGVTKLPDRAPGKQSWWDRALPGGKIEISPLVGTIKESQKGISFYTTREGFFGDKVKKGKYISGEKKGTQFRNEYRVDQGLFGKKLKGTYVEKRKDGTIVVSKYEYRQKDTLSSVFFGRGNIKPKMEMTKSETYIIRPDEARKWAGKDVQKLEKTLKAKYAEKIIKKAEKMGKGQYKESAKTKEPTTLKSSGVNEKVYRHHETENVKSRGAEREKTAGSESAKSQAQETSKSQGQNQNQGRGR